MRCCRRCSASAIASVLFADRAAGIGSNSTVTATLAGQIVMEGFLGIRLPHWARRLLTRAIAIVPVVVVTALYGERGTAQLLIFSQVILSMQLPFAVIPLVHVRRPTARRWAAFVDFASGCRAGDGWSPAIIVILNLKLLDRMHVVRLRAH